jgi:hypothetical protein
LDFVLLAMAATTSKWRVSARMYISHFPFWQCQPGPSMAGRSTPGDGADPVPRSGIER